MNEREITERIERVVYESFYPGPVAGSKERLAKALIAEFPAILALQPPGGGEDRNSLHRPAGAVRQTKCLSPEFETAERQHVPELEGAAYNQMPKTNEHRDLKLYRYAGTDLHQWFSKRGTSVFKDPCDMPFVIRSTPGGEVDTSSQLAEVRNALRLALKFAEDEAEQRDSAGGSMSDYITEANEVVDTVRSALRVAEAMR